MFPDEDKSLTHQPISTNAHSTRTQSHYDGVNTTTRCPKIWIFEKIRCFTNMIHATAQAYLAKSHNRGSGVHEFWWEWILCERRGENIVLLPQRHGKGNELWGVRVCFSTPRKQGGVEKREKVTELRLGRAVGWGRNLKLGRLGSCGSCC